MLKISNSLRDITEENSFLQFGLANQLLNLTKVAEYLKPFLEIRTKKEIKTSALLMNLSRLQRTQQKISPKVDDFSIQNISIISNLCVMTFQKDLKTHEEINKLFELIHKEKGFITLSEGNREITLIIDQTQKGIILNSIKKDTKHTKDNIVGISLKFDENYSESPGFIYLVLQTLTIQGINLVEISSTFTELIIYVEKKDTKLAFDTIFNRFG